MTVVADTSALVAFYSESGSHHDQVRLWVEAHGEPMVVSPYVVAELDYLAGTRKGVDAELAVLAELSGGAYELATMNADDIALAAEVIAKYRDLGIGIADASLVVLAAHYENRPPSSHSTTATSAPCAHSPASRFASSPNSSLQAASVSQGPTAKIHGPRSASPTPASGPPSNSVGAV